MNGRIVQKQEGFTLLELLIALFIFALLGAAATFSLRIIMQQQGALAERQQWLETWQQLDFWLRQDLHHAVMRPVRDEFGDTKAALEINLNANHILSLTRQGIANPLDEQRSQLARVEYVIEKGELIRRIRWRTDYTRQTPLMEMKLAQYVERIQVEVMNKEDEWQAYWQPTNNEGQRLLEKLPLAVRVTIDYQAEGRQEVSVRLPQSDML